MRQSEDNNGWGRLRSVRSHNVRVSSIDESGFEIVSQPFWPIDQGKMWPENPDGHTIRDMHNVVGWQPIGG